MFAIRLRVRPCKARCSPRSVGRSTVRLPFDRVTVISVLTTWLSSPFGPLTETSPGLTSTVTPSGTVIGFLPIRLIGIGSPYVGDDLAAHAAGLRLVPGHHAHRRAEDRGAHAAHHARDLLVGDVLAAPGS